jgi:SIR2-like domain
MSVPDIAPSETILFVGAGLSMHLGLPSWAGLIGKLGEELNFDVDIFRGLGSPLALAEYYQLEKGSIGPLRSLLDVEWHHPTIHIDSSIAHKLIVELGFPRIYTTNFDRWIEKSFEHWAVPYHKIINVNDIAGSKAGCTDIVKFHGDFDQDDTLVLTESSYFDRLEFESPLDILLRADALYRPILFIGYSLSDVNIRYLFHKLWKIWESAKISTARKKSHIFMSRPNPVEEALFAKWGITPIVDDKGGKVGLIEFLSSLGARPTA